MAGTLPGYDSGMNSKQVDIESTDSLPEPPFLNLTHISLSNRARNMIIITFMIVFCCALALVMLINQEEKIPSPSSSETIPVPEPVQVNGFVNNFKVVALKYAGQAKLEAAELLSV